MKALKERRDDHFCENCQDTLHITSKEWSRHQNKHKRMGR